MWPFDRYRKRRSKGPHVSTTALHLKNVSIITVSGTISKESDVTKLYQILKDIKRQAWQELRIDLAGVVLRHKWYDAAFVAIVVEFVRQARTRNAYCEIWFATRDPIQPMFSLSRIWTALEKHFKFYEDFASPQNDRLPIVTDKKITTPIH